MPGGWDHLSVTWLATGDSLNKTEEAELFASSLSPN